MAMPEGSSDHDRGCACAACCNHEIEEARGQARADGAGSIAPPAHVHGLVASAIWDGTALTYSFPDRGALYGQGATMSARYGTGEAADNFAALSTAQQVAAEFALHQFAAVSGLTFTRLDGEEAADASLRFGQSAQPGTAWGYYPSTFEEGGDVWLGRDEGYYDNPAPGEYGWHTILHETGHALGLRHGHDAGALDVSHDSMEFSVMTYRAFVGDPLIGGYSNAAGSYAQTLMQEDIAAAQQAYGANFDHMDGDTTYSWNPRTGAMTMDGVTGDTPVANTVFMTIWDGGGEDCFDFSRYRTDAVIDLRPGAASTGDEAQRAHLNADEPGGAAPVLASGSVYAALLHQGDERSLIENAIGGRGDDVITGNQAGNRLEGGRGQDRLIGMQGKDLLVGAHGNDILNGGGARDILNGGGGDDRLFGGGGRDKLNAGSGDDHLRGGAGNDKLIGGAGADRFIFQPGDGRDRIMDFTSGEDLIDLSAFQAGFSDLEIGQDHIAIGDILIRVTDIGDAGLTAEDFLF